MLDIAKIREEFPILSRRINGQPIVFADNAATSLKPRIMIRSIESYYSRTCSNVHRGINVLSEEAETLYENARGSVARLIGAHINEIVFVRNATEGINLAAHLLDLTEEDEVVCSIMDHHSNFLPWLTRSNVRMVKPDERGIVTVDSFLSEVNDKTKLIALGHISNVSGVITPVEGIIREARKRGILTLVDGAQSVPHIDIDVKELGCDFMAFSGHKMLGPSGIGVLYASSELLENGVPLLYGGGMVSKVSDQDFETAPVPHKYEAGTPNIEGAIGMGAAAEFLAAIGMDEIFRHGSELTDQLIAEIESIACVRLWPSDPTEIQVPILSFTVDGIEADDVSVILCNRYNIMVRSGVHCAEPFARHLGQNGLVRISLYLYNSLEEVVYIGDSLRKMCGFFAD